MKKQWILFAFVGACLIYGSISLKNQEKRARKMQHIEKLATLKPKRSVCLIVNPISGVKDKSALLEQVIHRLDPEHYDLEIHQTNAPLHATEIAQSALKKNIDIIAVMGGDGTLNEVGQAMIGSKAALAVIPTGSGNGLARHFHIPLQVDRAIDVLKSGRIKNIDTVRINEKTCLNVAGIGFDAEVGWSFAEKSRRGFLSYLGVAFRKFPTYKPVEYELMLDGKSISRQAFLISFANSSQYGSGAAISPKAKINDGLLDVVIIKKFPFYAAGQMLYRLFRNSLHLSDYVEIIQCKEIIIRQPDLRAHIDGEPIFFEDGVHIEINPASLNIIVPASRDDR